MGVQRAEVGHSDVVWAEQMVSGSTQPQSLNMLPLRGKVWTPLGKPPAKQSQSAIILPRPSCQPWGGTGFPQPALGKEGPRREREVRCGALSLACRNLPQHALCNHIHLLRDAAQLRSAHCRASPQVRVCWGDQILQVANVTLGGRGSHWMGCGQGSDTPGQGETVAPSTPTVSRSPPTPHLSQQDDPLHVGWVQHLPALQLAPERLLHQGLQLPHQPTPLGLAAHQTTEVQPVREAKGPS